MSDIASMISMRMRQLRQERQLTFQALADRAGMSKSHVFQLESGQSQNPTIASAVAIAAALGVSLDYLCGLASSKIDLHPEALRIACEVDALIRKRGAKS